jgi:hypothetical protein
VGPLLGRDCSIADEPFHNWTHLLGTHVTARLFDLSDVVLDNMPLTFAPWGNVPHHKAQQPTQRGHGAPDTLHISAIDVWHQRLCSPVTHRFEHEEPQRVAQYLRVSRQSSSSSSSFSFSSNNGLEVRKQISHIVPVFIDNEFS